MSRPSSYSQNDNQNYFTNPNHTSSKVLRPPGGGSSISLGWDDGKTNTHPDNDRFPPRVKHEQTYNSNPITGASYDSREEITNSSTYSMKSARKNQEITGKIGNNGGQQVQPLQHYNRQPSQQTQYNNSRFQQYTSNPNGAYDSSTPTQYRPDSEQVRDKTYTAKYQEQQNGVNGRGVGPRDQYSGNHNSGDRSHDNYSNPPQQQQQQQQYQQREMQQQQPDHNHQHLGISDSSNKFANGANQNCGNIITDRSSTRIHAPPGGHSSTKGLF